MKHLLGAVGVLFVIGCSPPPPTSTAALEREPTQPYWGEAQTPTKNLAVARRDPPLDFVVVAGGAHAGSNQLSEQRWLETIKTAAAENEPCVFTSFIGWESRTTEGDDSIERVFFMKGGATEAQEFAPVGLGHSAEGLHTWVGETAQRVGTDFVAVPYDDESSTAAETLRPADLDEIRFQGLTAAWAEENTRTSIFAAFERREVFATTGPRIRVRFFGGWSFKSKTASRIGMVGTGYLLGHPMGSELKGAADGRAPTFLMYAVKDPDGANLERIQVIKRWLGDDGEAHDRTYDVVRSADVIAEKQSRKEKRRQKSNTKRRKPTPPPPSGPDPGLSALSGFWEDPDFDPNRRAIYYMQALEVPTAQTSGGAAGAPDEKDADTRGRAYTSPIWYAPPP